MVIVIVKCMLLSDPALVWVAGDGGRVERHGDSPASEVRVKKYLTRDTEAT